MTMIKVRKDKKDTHAAADPFPNSPVAFIQKREYLFFIKFQQYVYHERNGDTDKKGATTAMALVKNPQTLSKLKRTKTKPTVKVIINRIF